MSCQCELSTVQDAWVAQYNEAAEEIQTPSLKGACFAVFWQVSAFNLVTRCTSKLSYKKVSGTAVTGVTC